MKISKTSTSVYRDEYSDKVNPSDGMKTLTKASTQTCRGYLLNDDFEWREKKNSRCQGVRQRTDADKYMITLL